jgi:hypothetical protein
MGSLDDPYSLARPAAVCAAKRQKTQSVSNRSEEREFEQLGHCGHLEIGMSAAPFNLVWP